MEGPIDNLTTNAPSGANAGSLLGHLASDITDGEEDDFKNIPPLEDSSDHDRKSGRPPKGTGKFKKVAKVVLSTTSQ